MSNSNHNLATVETPQFGAQDQNGIAASGNGTDTFSGSKFGTSGSVNGPDRADFGTVVRIANKCLNMGLAESKKWATDLNVSDRVIRSWTSGEKTIPTIRAQQIVAQAKFYLLGLHSLENAIDQMLVRAYGPNVDRGIF